MKTLLMILATTILFGAFAFAGTFPSGKTTEDHVPFPSDPMTVPETDVLLQVVFWAEDRTGEEVRSVQFFATKQFIAEVRYRPGEDVPYAVYINSCFLRDGTICPERNESFNGTPEDLEKLIIGTIQNRARAQ